VKIIVFLICMISIGYAEIFENMSWESSEDLYVEYILKDGTDECTITYVNAKNITSHTCIEQEINGIKELCTPAKGLCENIIDLNLYAAENVSLKADETESIYYFLDEWNDLISKHKIHIVGKKLYSKNISYYNKRNFSRIDALADKANFFSKYPNFKQEVKSIDYEKNSSNKYIINFAKKVSINNKINYYLAYLVLIFEDNQLKIIEEGDQSTTSMYMKQGFEAMNLKNYLKAEELFIKACERGNSNACYNLAITYVKDLTAVQNYFNAALLFKKACNNGLKEACFGLGTLYENGKGVIQNVSKAATFYKLACDKGHTTACNDLAVKYMTGKGVLQDYTKASVLFKKTCDDGISDACISYGMMNLEGKGMTKNYTIAKKMFKKACSLDNSRGCLLYLNLKQKENGVIK
jgi:uncharacterized protein